MKLEDYLAIPYRLVAYSAARPDGTRRRFAAYPEIGCVSKADTPIEAQEQLEELRIRYIIDHVQREEADSGAAAATQVTHHGARSRASRLCKVAGGEPAPERRKPTLKVAIITGGGKNVAVAGMNAEMGTVGVWSAPDVRPVLGGGKQELNRAAS